MIQCSLFISQYMPIHINTYQYVWHTKYWIEIRAQYFHACIDCIDMYYFLKYKPNTCKYKPIQTQYFHDGLKTCGRQPPRIGMYWYKFCMNWACICLYLLVLGGGHRPQVFSPSWKYWVCIGFVLACICMYWACIWKINTC